MRNGPGSNKHDTSAVRNKAGSNEHETGVERRSSLFSEAWTELRLELTTRGTKEYGPVSTVENNRVHSHSFHLHYGVNTYLSISVNE